MRSQKIEEPQIAKWILSQLSKYEEEFAFCGDLGEEFKEIADEQGSFKAHLWYWAQVLYAIPSYCKYRVEWSAIMFKNYVKIAVRIVMKHKVFSFINVFSLSIGIAGSILITLFVLDELSFDKFHENAGDLYRVEQDQFDPNRFHVNMTPHPLAPAIIEEIPEIEYAARFAKAGRCLMRYKDRYFSEFGVRGVDPSFLEMFTFPFSQGDKLTALQDPYSIVITEAMAEKYFGDESPVSKTISVNNRYDVRVTGVIENVPSNSSLQYDMLIPYNLLEIFGKIEDSWGNNLVTFVQLYKDASIPTVNKKITDLCFRKMEAVIRESDPDYLEKFKQRKRTEFMLKPVTEIRLSISSHLLNIRYFSLIALIVLLIACINFMNLSTARSTLRAKEIGMRKVVGAMKGNIIRQFYTESITLSVLAFLLSLIIVQLFLPIFNSLAQKNLSFHLAGNLRSVIIIVFITIFTGVVAGSYPALFLSAFKPITVLKGNTKSETKSPVFRKLLVILQFTLFIIFMVCTITVYNQVTYLRNREPGYNRELLSYICLRDENRAIYPTLKNELIKGSQIAGVTGAYQLPFAISSNRSDIKWEGRDIEESNYFNMCTIDYNYIETVGLEILRGQSFSKAFSGTSSPEFLVNEKVEQMMGMESAVGNRFHVGSMEGTIIGVVKNFNYRSLDHEIGPLILFLTPMGIHDNPFPINYVIIKIQKDNSAAAVEYIDSVWKKFVPDEPLEFFFFKDTMGNLYASQKRLGDIFKNVLILVAIIACLGLFGLSLFSLERRTKEIGIRKVLGSSITDIFGLIIKEYFIWISCAYIVAIPVAYFIMNKWLDNFAYRINLGWQIFLLAGLIASAITLFTISFQTIKAVNANPLDSLRYE